MTILGINSLFEDRNPPLVINGKSLPEFLMDACMATVVSEEIPKSDISVAVCFSVDMKGTSIKKKTISY